MAQPQSLEERRKIFEERLRRIRERWGLIRHKLAIMSGKGGVGKSFIASNLSVALAKLGFRVGLLDIDFHGPSSYKILGIGLRQVIATEAGIEPVLGPLGIKVMCIAFLLPSEQTPIIWRGPLKSVAIMQFISDVNWGELDYLIIDMPPGTGDEAITVAKQLPPIDGAIFITIPSELSVIVVGRSIEFARTVGIKPLGLIENMSYLRVGNNIVRVFGKASAQELSKRFGIEYLGSIPLDPRIAESCDEGAPYVIKYPNTEGGRAIMEIAKKIVKLLEG